MDDELERRLAALRSDPGGQPLGRKPNDDKKLSDDARLAALRDPLPSGELTAEDEQRLNALSKGVGGPTIAQGGDDHCEVLQDLRAEEAVHKLLARYGGDDGHDVDAFTLSSEESERDASSSLDGHDEDRSGSRVTDEQLAAQMLKEAKRKKDQFDVKDDGDTAKEPSKKEIQSLLKEAEECAKIKIPKKEKRYVDDDDNSNIKFRSDESYMKNHAESKSDESKSEESDESESDESVDSSDSSPAAAARRRGKMAKKKRKEKTSKNRAEEHCAPQPKVVEAPSVSKQKDVTNVKYLLPTSDDEDPNLVYTSIKGNTVSALAELGLIQQAYEEQMAHCQKLLSRGKGKIDTAVLRGAIQEAERLKSLLP